MDKEEHKHLQQSRSSQNPHKNQKHQRPSTSAPVVTEIRSQSRSEPIKKFQMGHASQTQGRLEVASKISLGIRQLRLTNDKADMALKLQDKKQKHLDLQVLVDRVEAEGNEIYDLTKLHDFYALSSNLEVFRDVFGAFAGAVAYLGSAGDTFMSGVLSPSVSGLDTLSAIKGVLGNMGVSSAEYLKHSENAPGKSTKHTLETLLGMYGRLWDVVTAALEGTIEDIKQEEDRVRQIQQEMERLQMQKDADRIKEELRMRISKAKKGEEKDARSVIKWGRRYILGLQKEDVEQDIERGEMLRYIPGFLASLRQVEQGMQNWQLEEKAKTLKKELSTWSANYVTKIVAGTGDQDKRHQATIALQDMQQRLMKHPLWK
ncbi:MAG: hypothetical protein HRT35_21905 [Algicola sp.]|nr:hypothetical protein [Algicola sp.]